MLKEEEEEDSHVTEHLTLHFPVSRQTQSETHPVCDVEQLNEGPGLTMAEVPTAQRRYSYGYHGQNLTGDKRIFSPPVRKSNETVGAI